jgi:N-acetylglucosaminyl-diphospho-decaprenol L-rhamnosyltransferase
MQYLMQNNNITLSIVSHGHGDMVEKLLGDIKDNSAICKIIITKNIIGENIECPSGIAPNVVTIENTHPKGFSENHNFAFKEHCDSDFFCVLNPDIRITENPFPPLISCMNSGECAITGPMVRDVEGDIQDSARYFPGPFTLALKAIGCDLTRFPLSSSSAGIVYPDWVAGMFMLIKSSWFKQNLFDENFFLYYEDIDLCLRCWKSGNTLAFVQEVSVIHDARRDSHKKLNYFLLHVRSIVYFLYKNYLRFPKKHGLIVSNG